MINGGDGLFGGLARDELMFAAGIGCVILLAAICVMRWRWRSRRRRGGAPFIPVQRVVLFPSEPFDHNGVEWPATDSDTARRQPLSSADFDHGPQPKASMTATMEHVRTAIPTPEPGVAVGVVRRRPKPAVVAIDTTVPPEALLAAAHELLTAGRPEQAAVQLRLCVRAAGHLKLPLIEAAARMELGDLASASGDLTTACEHWQMARSLFTQTQRVEHASAIETRMEAAGCPTDWVLTQF